MKKTKKLRALVVADEEEEVLVNLETLVDWGLLPDCFPLPIDVNDRVGGKGKVRSSKDQAPKKRDDINPHQAGVSESLIRRGGADLPPTCLWLSEGIFIIFFKQGSCLGCKGPESKSTALYL